MLRERVRMEILEAYLADTLKTRILMRDGSYRRAWQSPASKRATKPRAAGFNAQEFLILLSEGKQTLQAIPSPSSRSRRRSVAVRS